MARNELGRSIRSHAALKLWCHECLGLTSDVPFDVSDIPHSPKPFSHGLVHDPLTKDPFRSTTPQSGPVATSSHKLGRDSYKPFPDHQPAPVPWQTHKHKELTTATWYAPREDLTSTVGGLITARILELKCHRLQTYLNMTSVVVQSHISTAPSTAKS